MKYKRKQQEIECEQCGKIFSKDISEIKRNSKLNRKNYCSRKCLGLANSVNLNGVVRTTSHLRANNRLDEYSMFRQHLKRAERRKHDCTITLEEMKEVFDRQEGKCVYSKVDLIPASYRGYNNPIYTISLDRVDSSIGYTKNNIQFISIAMNHLKNNMSHSEMLEVIEIMKNIN